jgi:hypothetical protein
MGETVHGYSLAFLGISVAMVVVSLVSLRLKRRLEETKLVMGA